MFSRNIISEERSGRNDLARNLSLPVDLGPDELLEEMGFELGEPIAEPSRDGVPLFRAAELPEGWESRPDPKNHRVVLVFDQEDNVRLSIFYKSASYDPKAYGIIKRRYEVVQNLELEEAVYQLQFVDTKSAEVLYKTDAVEWKKEGLSPHETRDELQAECEQWANENVPGWDDVAEAWQH